VSGAPATTVRRVVVIAKTGSPEGPRIASELGPWLAGRGVDVCYEDDTAEAIGRDGGLDRRDLPGADIDLAIVAGGDGTLLSVARAVMPCGIPILGVNLGSLGFLTELQPSELYRGLEAVLAGRYTIDERQSLRVRLQREGLEDEEYSVLNDVVITKSTLARMIDIEVDLDGDKVAVYTSDGLIVSTPTGSTAYALSAGGPILDPRMSAFVIAPICPHTMTYRPLVVPATGRLLVSARSEDDEVYLTLDGQIGFPFGPADSILVETHPRAVRLVRVAGRGFFEVLRRKLRWGER
jgi:NAD+ kinase